MAAGSGKKTGAGGTKTKTAANGSAGTTPVAEKLAAMVQQGACFSVWTADYDANDLYPLRIEELGDDGAMVLSYPDPPARSEIRCSADAIERGTGVVFLSQFSALAGKAQMKNRALATKTHSPPFLLSRESVRRLKAGESVPLEVYSGSFNLKLFGEAQTTVRINEQPVKVRVLHAQDDGESDWSPVDLWVLDHPKWPLLMKLDFGGECELSLFEIKPVS